MRNGSHPGYQDLEQPMPSFGCISSWYGIQQSHSPSTVEGDDCNGVKLLSSGMIISFLLSEFQQVESTVSIVTLHSRDMKS